MAKTLKQIKEQAAQLIGEVTIDNDTGKIEDDNSSPNKSLQRTPKNTKSVRQQPNVSSQKQLPPPQKTALANPSRVPVVVPSSNVPDTLKPKPTTPAVQDKKPDEKYMGKVYPEKKPGISKPVPPNKEKPEAKKPESKPEASKPVPPNKEKLTQASDEKPEVKTAEPKPSATPPKPSVPKQVNKKESPIIKTGEGDSRSNLDLRGSRAGFGARYSGPEHLIKAPVRPGRR